LSVVLVAGATMLARSLNKLEHQDFGYQVQGRVVVGLHNPPAGIVKLRRSAQTGVYENQRAQLSRIPISA
jgi:hypothetical protein